MFVATMVFGLLPIWLVKHFLYSSGDEGSHHEAAAREDKRRTRLKKTISFASCFSGGVFIAACLLDLLPGRFVLQKKTFKQLIIVFLFADVHEAFDHVLDEIELVYHTKIDYPVAEFIIVVGKT